MLQNLKATVFILSVFIFFIVFFATLKKEKILILKPINERKKENLTSPLCKELLNGNLSAVQKNETQFDRTSDEEVQAITSRGCSAIVRQYRFETESASFREEERNFPIAFTILAHRSAQQLLLLLSQIYAPQNVYCLHIDLKAPRALYGAMQNVEKCFSNIVLASKRESIVYASFSRLQADLICMKDLLRSVVPWSHLINLSGMDFPTKTNLDIVRALKQLNGTNKIPGDEHPNKYNIDRTKFVYKIVNTTTEDGGVEEKLKQTYELKSPPPHNITLRKNLAYNVYARAFLRSVILESEKARDLLEWSRDTQTPDEHYWLMLDALDEAPARTGRINWDMLTPFVVWKSSTKRCGGYWRHYSCVFGYDDIPTLVNQRKLFANKFDIANDSLPITCVRSWLLEKNQRQKLEP